MRYPCVWMALASTLTAAAQPALRSQIVNRLAGFEGRVTLYAKNLDTGAAIGIGEKDPVRTASTIKLPVMLAVFDAVARGKAQWTEKLRVNAADRVSGSGVIGTELSDGVELPLRDVVNLMITVSDNSATNMVLERFSADAVNAYLDKIGVRETRSLRKVRGDGSKLKDATGWSAAGKLPANQKYGLGVSTPLDMVTILEKLHRGELVSPEASREMIAILKRCQDDSGIRRRHSSLPVANKTGALDALRSDVGIVYSTGGPIAMAITVDEMKQGGYTPDNPGSLLIAELAQMLVEGLQRN